MKAYERIKENILLLSATKEFMADILNLRKKYPFAIHDDADYYEHEKELREMSDEITRIRRKYELSEIHEIAIQIYKNDISFNGLKDIIEQSHLKLSLRYVEEPKYKKHVTVDIFPETTEEELIAFFRELRNYQKERNDMPSSRERLSPQLERDVEIAQLRNEGKYTDKEIMSIINKKYASTIGYEQIPPIIQRLDKKINKRFNIAVK